MTDERDAVEVARAELLPCPFCGGTFVAQGASNEKISVWCADCDARGPSEDFPDILIEPLIPICKCREAWNRRAALTALTAAGTDMGELAAYFERASKHTWQEYVGEKNVTISHERCIEAATALIAALAREKELERDLADFKGKLDHSAKMAKEQCERADDEEAVRRAAEARVARMKNLVTEAISNAHDKSAMLAFLSAALTQGGDDDG